MKVGNIKKDEITISLTKDEFGFLTSAIGEALEAVAEWEFQTRTNMDYKKAEEMLDIMNGYYYQIPD